jgi:hypothetical protein
MTKIRKPAVQSGKPRTATVELVMSWFSYYKNSPVFLLQPNPLSAISLSSRAGRFSLKSQPGLNFFLKKKIIPIFQKIKIINPVQFLI